MTTPSNPQYGRRETRVEISDILVEANVITAQQLTEALKSPGKPGRKTGEILIEQGLITPTDLARVLSIQLNKPLIDLQQRKAQPGALRLVPEAMARQYNVLPLEIVDGVLLIVTAQPENMQALEALSLQAKMRVDVGIGNSEDIRRAINLSYRSIDEIEKQVSRIAPPATESRLGRATIPVGVEDDAPIGQVLDLLVNQAVRDHASDIHIEPQETSLRVRYRIDGILHQLMSLPPNVHDQLISRVKILAEMNIAERRKPQDGQFSTKVDEKEIDIRVATIDSAYGERAVLRILDKTLALFTLPQLGFLPDFLGKYRQMVNSPFGMIAIGGPTGSGKTTTLYASINELDQNERNIMTVEDPIEYRFQGINQIQVNPRAGITFASGLRAIMRHDPDIILVGEIRDDETAKIAVQSALTGHLVLSSVHANDAVGVLFRLLDLGVEPYLVSSALIGVLAQRMVRRICPHCRVPYDPPLAEKMAYQEQMGEEQVEFYHGAGCNFCANTGYLGRIGVFEVLAFSEKIGHMLLTGSSSDQIHEQALKEEMAPMMRDGMLKVKEGMTTIHEILRSVFSVGQRKSQT